MAVPNSYKDPSWNATERVSEQKFGLPAGTLSRFRLAERSNSDLSSPKGAKTVYQFMPDTAKWVQQQTGINPYSPNQQEQSDGAGWYVSHLLNLSHGNLAEAAARYNAGYRPAVWKTPGVQKYIRDVTGGSGLDGATAIPGAGGIDPVTAQMYGLNRDDEQPVQEPETPVQQQPSYVDSLLPGKDSSAGSINAPDSPFSGSAPWLNPSMSSIAQGSASQAPDFGSWVQKYVRGLMQNG